ncbi:MAG TPA: hypothetical protein VHA13_02875 [Gammaproteobacteria bacterium]|nr:hypothetical protein [Gammaproteobacteria bacterium]
MTNEPTAKIFLIEPADRLKYKSILAFADTSEDARLNAHTLINPAKIKMSGDPSPMMDMVYLNEELSTCHEIKNFETIWCLENSIQIKYLGKMYCLAKDSAKPLDSKS